MGTLPSDHEIYERIIGYIESIDDKELVYFSEIEGYFWRNYQARISKEKIEHCIRLINSKPFFLNNYRLDIVVTDSGSYCESTIKAFRVKKKVEFWQVAVISLIIYMIYLYLSH